MEIEEVVRGLSEAQEKLIRAMSERPKKWRAVQRHAKLAVWPWLPRGACSWSSYGGQVSLTPLGLAVRAHLERTTHADR